MSVARYYSWLTRFQDVVRHVGHDTGQRTLTVHRLLRAAPGAASGDVLHERLLRVLVEGDEARPDESLRVLDAGSGLGGTAFFLHSHLGGRYVGVTLSPRQCERATNEAKRRGLSAACRFTVRSYDDDLRDVLPEGADLIVAIESLAHAPRPAGTVAHLAAFLRPRGRLAIVDDMPAEALRHDDADLAAFRDGWLCPAVAKASTLRAALEAAGLVVAHDEDLTPLIPLRHPHALGRLVRLNRAMYAALRATPARVLLESMHGGLMLERLYRREMMSYRLIVARRP